MQLLNVYGLFTGKHRPGALFLPGACPSPTPHRPACGYPCLSLLSNKGPSFASVTCFWSLCIPAADFYLCNFLNFLIGKEANSTNFSKQSTTHVFLNPFRPLIHVSM